MKRIVLGALLSAVLLAGMSSGGAAFAGGYGERMDGDIKGEMRMHLESYCEMSDADRQAYIAENDKADHEAKLNEYCTLDEDGKAAFIDENKGHYAKHAMMGKMMEKLESYCEMSDADRADYIAENGKEKYQDKLNEYCTLDDEEAKAAFVKEAMAEHMKDGMKDKLQDKKMMLESYCEMSAEEKQAYLAENNKERYADQINQYCTLDEEGKKAYLDQVKEQYRDKELRDKLKDKKMVLEAYCEMSDADKEAYITENGKEKYADQINKYCTLDDDGKAAYLDMVKEQYRDKGSKDRMMEKIKDKKMMLESYCEMSDADRQSFIKENNKEKYQDKLNEYCSLDDDGKKAFIADLKEQYRDKQASDKAKANLQDKKAKLESYCEMSDADRQAYITENGKERYQDKLNEYCTLDMDGKKAYFDELKSQYRGYYDSKGSAAHVASEMSSIKSELDGLSGLDSADKETLRQDIISRAMSMQLGWVTPAGGDDAAVQDAAGCDEESVLVTYASSGEQACVVYEDSIDLIDSGAATLAN